MFARNTDPKTSHEAAQAATENLSQTMLDITNALKNKCLTAQDVSERTGKRLNTVSTTLSRMAKEGYVSETGYDCRNPETGRFNTMYCMPDEKKYFVGALENRIKAKSQNIRKSATNNIIVSEVYALYSFEEEYGWDFVDVFLNIEDAEAYAGAIHSVGAKTSIKKTKIRNRMEK